MKKYADLKRKGREEQSDGKVVKNLSNFSAESLAKMKIMGIILSVRLCALVRVQ